MVAQIQSTIKTEIISTYVSDFDGLTIDTIQMTYPDGHTEVRLVGLKKTSTRVKQLISSGLPKEQSCSAWKTTRNNKWLVSYKSIKLATKQSEMIAHNTALEVLASPENYNHAEYLKAKADLGF
ncbi:hypothetical protein PCC7821_05155 (plasmid) [Planktothrix rubescens NIVA-CYA 18]|nr:hypothetical protein PCC7821_05155 [Planktothrix rubescens NIVA-CYA 18]